MSKAGHAAPVALHLAKAFPPHKSGSRLRFVRNFLLCFALPLSVISAQTPQPTPQPSGQSQQQIQPAQPNQPSPRPPRNWGPNGLGNAASGLVMNPTQDTVPPQLPADLIPGGVLIFAKTLGYRDEPAIQASNAALAAIAHEHGWPYFITENGAVMNPGQLAKFKLVIWNNASGDPLNDEQKAAFKAWIEAGGSFLGIHGAGGDPVREQARNGHSSLADWKWYIDDLIGAQFIVHSTIQPGDIHIEDHRSALTKGLPLNWHRTEEWYSFDSSPRGKLGFHIVATVDEKSYAPGSATMGTDHPLIWWHCVGQGHAVYSALGHAGSFYAEPLMIQFLDDAMSWGLAESDKGCRATKP